MRTQILIRLLLGPISLIAGSGCMIDVRVTDLAANNQNSISEDSPAVSNPSEPTSPISVPATHLKLTGYSSNVSDVSLRVFNENSGPWALSGSCSSSNGAVLISGDINASFSVNCENDAFSTSINYASVSPFFNSSQGTARKIIVTQGAETDEVNLYKTSSAHTIKFIRSMSDFVDLSSYPDGIFIIANDIDASNGGANPLNNFSFSNVVFNEFIGELQGDNHILSNFNRISGGYYSCLIAVVGRGAVFKNIRMINFQLSTETWGTTTYIAPLFCSDNSSVGTGTILFENIYLQGEIASTDGDTFVAGLGASMTVPVIANNIDADINFSGNALIVGGLFATSSQAVISKAKVMGNFSVTTKPNNPVGGLIGSAGYSSKVTQVNNSYFVGTINNGEIIGGLIGKIVSNGQLIENSYVLSDIAVANGKVGGPVIGSTGSYTYNISNVYYSTDRTCTLCTNFLGSGKNDIQLKSQSTFTGWDFINIWSILEGVSFPAHR